MKKNLPLDSLERQALAAGETASSVLCTDKHEGGENPLREVSGFAGPFSIPRLARGDKREKRQAGQMVCGDRRTPDDVQLPVLREGESNLTLEDMLADEACRLKKCRVEPPVPIVKPDEQALVAMQRTTSAKRGQVLDKGFRNCYFMQFFWSIGHGPDIWKVLQPKATVKHHNFNTHNQQKFWLVKAKETPYKGGTQEVKTWWLWATWTIATGGCLVPITSTLRANPFDVERLRLTSEATLRDAYHLFAHFNSHNKREPCGRLYVKELFECAGEALPDKLVKVPNFRRAEVEYVGEDDVLRSQMVAVRRRDGSTAVSLSQQDLDDIEREIIQPFENISRPVKVLGSCSVDANIYKMRGIVPSVIRVPRIPETQRFPKVGFKPLEDVSFALKELMDSSLNEKKPETPPIEAESGPLLGLPVGQHESITAIAEVEQDVAKSLLGLAEPCRGVTPIGGPSVEETDVSLEAKPPAKVVKTTRPVIKAGKIAIERNARRAVAPERPIGKITAPKPKLDLNPAGDKVVIKTVASDAEPPTDEGGVEESKNDDADTQSVPAASDSPARDYKVVIQPLPKKRKESVLRTLGEAYAQASATIHDGGAFVIADKPKPLKDALYLTSTNAMKLIKYFDEKDGLRVPIRDYFSADNGGVTWVIGERKLPMNLPAGVFARLPEEIATIVQEMQNESRVNAMGEQPDETANVDDLLVAPPVTELPPYVGPVPVVSPHSTAFTAGREPNDESLGVKTVYCSFEELPSMFHEDALRLMRADPVRKCRLIRTYTNERRFKISIKYVADAPVNMLDVRAFEQRNGEIRADPDSKYATVRITLVKLRSNKPFLKDYNTKFRFSPWRATNNAKDSVPEDWKSVYADYPIRDQADADCQYVQEAWFDRRSRSELWLERKICYSETMRLAVLNSLLDRSSEQAALSTVLSGLRRTAAVNIDPTRHEQLNTKLVCLVQFYDVRAKHGLDARFPSFGAMVDGHAKLGF